MIEIYDKGILAALMLMLLLQQERFGKIRRFEFNSAWVRARVFTRKAWAGWCVCMCGSIMSTGSK